MYVFEQRRRQNKQKTLNFVETSTTFYMAMNKLMEEKRYEEVAQLGRKCLSDYESKPSDMSFTLRNDLGKLYSNALLEINDASALDQAKHLVQTVSAHKQQMGTQSICALFALATQQVLEKHPCIYIHTSMIIIVNSCCSCCCGARGLNSTEGLRFCVRFVLVLFLAAAYESNLHRQAN